VSEDPNMSALGDGFRAPPKPAPCCHADQWSFQAHGSSAYSFFILVEPHGLDVSRHSHTLRTTPFARCALARRTPVSRRSEGERPANAWSKSWHSSL